MGQTHTCRGRATVVTHNPLKVRYHATTVVEQLPDGQIRLNSGGHRTYTTKTRMNQAARQFVLGFTVWQKNFEWFVTISRDEQDEARTIPFTDNMVISCAY